LDGAEPDVLREREVHEDREHDDRRNDPGNALPSSSRHRCLPGGCGGGPGETRPTTLYYFYLTNSDAARTLSSTWSGVCVPPTSASPPASHASATSGTVTVSSQMMIWDASLARSMPSMIALLDVFSLTAPMTVLGCEYGVVASVEA